MYPGRPVLISVPTHQKEAVTQVSLADHDRKVKESQQKRWEKIRQSQTALDVYLGILDSDALPNILTLFSVPDSVVLPLSLSEHLEEIRSATMGDGRERVKINRLGTHKKRSFIWRISNRIS